MVVKKDIIYPIFLECIEHIDDKFWENIFEDLAYGKTPYGTYINKNFFSCNYKDKEFSYKIEKNDPEQLYNDIYSLLNTKLGLLSPRDKIKKKTDFINIEDEIKEGRKNWSKIRKKNIKELLIENYVIAMKNKYSLTIKQVKYLLSVIFIGMVFKIINTKDIHYNDGVINKIDGIGFKKREVIILRDIYDIDINTTNIILEEKNLISYNWNKYLENLRKLEISV
jgi:hypothetical protein